MQHGESGLRERLAVAESKHPDYFDVDPVLDRLLVLFEGAVGPEPSTEELTQLHAEAARRLQERIPPGYCDSAKGDLRAHGDDFLWRQILSHAKQVASPVVLVTSERKDDWWEKVEGRRLGLRRELREEAMRESGQLILIYEREHFVAEAARHFQVPVTEGVLRDIRDLERNKQGSENLFELVEAVLDKVSNDLVDSEEISSCIAETNASGFYPYQVEVTTAGPLDLEEASLPFEATIYFEGEQEEDRMYAGTNITAELAGTIAYDGDEWTLLDGYNLRAEVDQDEPDGDDEDE